MVRQEALQCPNIHSCSIFSRMVENHQKHIITPCSYLWYLTNKINFFPKTKIKVTISASNLNFVGGPYVEATLSRTTNQLKYTPTTRIGLSVFYHKFIAYISPTPIPSVQLTKIQILYLHFA